MSQENNIEKETPEKIEQPQTEQTPKTNEQITKLEKDVERLTKELEQAKMIANENKPHEPEISDFDRIFRKEIV